jgi:long-chain acyl-CoA synthetase
MGLDIELYRRSVYMPVECRQVARRISVIEIEPEVEVTTPPPTLVFLHGYGGSAVQWLHQIRFFGQYTRVIALDMRGHGLSDDPPPLPYSIDELVEDVHYILEELNVHRPFWLIAHSFGGAVATEYALRYPDALLGLVLVGVPSRFVLRPILSRAIKSIPDPIFSFGARVLGIALHAPQRTLRAMLGMMSTWHGESRFSQLRVPTLVILGQRDTVFLREYYEEVPRHIANVQRVVISVSAHLVQLERPGAVNRAIRRFIEATHMHQYRATGAAAGVVGNGPVSLFRTNPRFTANRLATMPWLQYYDDGVPEQVPVSKQLLHDLLSNTAGAYPRGSALIFFGQRISYHELDLLSNRFSRVLHALGVRQGERVAIVLPNVPQCVIAFYGTLKAGAVVVLGSPLSSTDELRYQLRDSEAKVLLTLTSYRAQSEQMCRGTRVAHVIYTDAREYLPLPQRVLLASLLEESIPHSQQTGETLAVVRDTPFTPLSSWREHAFQQLLRQQSSHSLCMKLSSEQLALLQYTSGTTDAPKGVMLSHRNLMINLVQVRSWMPDARRGREIVLCVLPLSHAYGITDAMNVTVGLAGTLVLLPTNRIREVMNAIREYHPSILPGVPSLYQAIANYPNVRAYGVASIRICISGSAPLPVESQEAFEKLTKGHLVEGYGLTEASPVTHSNPLKGERRIGSIGLPLPGTFARIVDPQTDEPLSPGQVGELVIQGPQVMQGYWHMPEETAQVLRHGWLHTGDLARMDEDGFFSIVDRKKDLILAGTYNVYPRDVEEVLYEHPKVLEAAVVGANNPSYIKAFVVLKRGEQATADELLALCRERLDAYKVPAQVEFRTELPKNIVGKVLRRLLVEA